nr:hypothetical protein [Tanacetum cinerariifolium]
DVLCSASCPPGCCNDICVNIFGHNTRGIRYFCNTYAKGDLCPQPRLQADPCATRVPLQPLTNISEILRKPSIGLTYKKGSLTFQKGSVSVAGMSQTWSSESRLSSCSKHCSLPPVQTAAPYLLCKMLLLTSCAECCSLLLVQTATPHRCSLLPEQTAAPYFLCKHYSLVIASGPEVTFIISAIPVDRSNME